MAAHIHAALMAEYAKDALETDKPWERWEVKGGITGPWESLDRHPVWATGNEYRRKRAPLCQVEGRDVYAGDKLFAKTRGEWVVAVSTKDMPEFLTVRYRYEDSYVAYENLSWTEPARTKTVYQWAFKYQDGWFMTAGFFETVEQAKRSSGDSSMNFRRLDYTAMEVPV